MYLTRLVYRSECAIVGSAAEIDTQVASIVQASRVANDAAGLTGALLFSSGVFIQVLEGPTGAVEAVFERICGDLRHRRVRLLQLAPAEERMFGDWSMGYTLPAACTLELSQRLRNGEMPKLDAAAAEDAIAALSRSLQPITGLPLRATY